MTTFAEQQAARDALHESLPSLPVGTSCRRWSTCDRCGHRSHEMEFLTEQVAWEDDHTMFGCDPEPEPEPIDIDLNLWPYPTVWTFTREYAELDATTHVYRPLNTPVSGRAPQAMTRRAA